MDNQRNSLILTFSLAGALLLALVYTVSSRYFHSYEQDVLRARSSDFVRTRLTQAHLWFEEAISGDSSLVPERDVYPAIREVKDLLIVMQNGGTHSIGQFDAEDEPQDLDTLRRLIDETKAFEGAAIRRWEQRASSGGVGSQLDQTFDQAYENLMASTDHMARRHDSRLRATSQQMQIAIYALLTLAVLGLGGYSLRNRARLADQLAVSMRQAEDLRRSEKQLQEQQEELKAAEEELRQNLEEMTATQEEMQRMTRSLADQNSNLMRAQTELEANRVQLETQRQIEARLGAYADIFRWRPDDDMNTWGLRVMDALMHDLDGLQACLMMSDEFGGKSHLVPVATYACDLAALPNAVPVGDGISGQVALSRKPFWIERNDRANLYNQASTSFAKVTAEAVVVHPLIYNEEVEGVLEMLFVEPVDERKRVLIERLAPMLAAQLLTLRNQQRMKQLFQEATERAEALQAQEEELRQNLEELYATQEEMKRIQRELEQNFRPNGGMN